MSDRNSKRDKVLGKTTQKRKTPGWVIPVALGLLPIVAVAVQYLRQPPSNTSVGGQAGAVNYQSGARIEQTPITTAVLSGGKITVPLAEVQSKKLVGFLYKGKQQLPLLAYIAPSGKVVTAVSECEPCNSTTFHIEGDQLVCNTCGTRWTLEGLAGISGGCTRYPPDAFPNTLEGDRIVIQESSVATWQRRV